MSYYRNPYSSDNSETLKAVGVIVAFIFSMLLLAFACNQDLDEAEFYSSNDSDDYYIIHSNHSTQRVYSPKTNSYVTKGSNPSRSNVRTNSNSTNNRSDNNRSNSNNSSTNRSSNSNSSRSSTTTSSGRK